MSTTLKFSPSGDRPNGLKIRVYGVRLTAWAHKFTNKVDRSGGPAACWPWNGRRGGSGYGEPVIKQPGVRCSFLAHRLAYEAANGAIPAGLLVRHSCHNRLCCNPAHLSLGTVADNSRDMVEAGRQAKPKGELNPHAKLTFAAVVEIRAARAEGVSLADLSARYLVSKSVICNAARGNTWRHVGASR